MSHLPSKTLRANVFHRRATYVVGTDDTGSKKLDDSCAAQLQGHNRYERAVNYWNYIRRFPEWKANAEFVPIRSAGHLSLANSTVRKVINLLFDR